MQEYVKQPSDLVWDKPQQRTLEEYLSVREPMLQKFKRTQMEFELQIYLDRVKWVQEDDLSAWFLATRERTAIFHLFNLTERFPDGITVQEVSRFLKIARSTVSRLLSEAHGCGFIHRNKKIGYSRYYVPSQHLLDNGDYYAEYYVDNVIKREWDTHRSEFFNYKRVEKMTRERLRRDDVDDPY